MTRRAEIERLARAARKARKFVGGLKGSQFLGDTAQHKEAFAVMRALESALAYLSATEGK